MGARDRPSALADTYEAVLGAVFLDGGFEAAREFVLRQFRGAFSTLAVMPLLDNPKGELQELLQSSSIEAPRYHVVSATGPDHDRLFECTVHHGGIELARGHGKSKKAAESEAAMAALMKLREKQRDVEPPPGPESGAGGDPPPELSESTASPAPEQVPPSSPPPPPPTAGTDGASEREVGGTGPGAA